MYLINEEHALNFSELISGKRLFRMKRSKKRCWLGVEIPDWLFGVDSRAFSPLYLEKTMCYAIFFVWWGKCTNL